MNGIVKIVGRKEPLYISMAKVAKLQKMILEKDEKDIVQVEHNGGVWTGRISDIRSVERGHERTNDVSERIKADEQEEYRRYLRLTPEQRAQSVGKFKLWWGINYGERISQDPPQGLIARAIKAQKKWYTENPKVIHPNRTPSSVFESIMPKNAQKKPKTLSKTMDERRKRSKKRAKTLQKQQEQGRIHSMTNKQAKHNNKQERNADLCAKRDSDPKKWSFAKLGDLYNISAATAFEIYKREKAKKKESQLPHSLRQKYPKLAEPEQN